MKYSLFILEAQYINLTSSCFPKHCRVANICICRKITPAKTQLLLWSDHNTDFSSP